MCVRFECERKDHTKIDKSQGRSLAALICGERNLQCSLLPPDCAMREAELVVADVVADQESLVALAE
jgi:hypothetical protein